MLDYIDPFFTKWTGLVADFMRNLSFSTSRPSRLEGWRDTLRMMMLFIPVLALLSPGGNAMRNLASHETALEIEGQDKNDSLLGRWKQMVHM